MTQNNSIIQGTRWVVMSRIGVLTLNLISNALLVRLLTPADTGLYFLIFSLTCFCALLGQLGQDKIVVRMVATDVVKKNFNRASNIALQAFKNSSIAFFLIAIILCAGPGKTFIQSCSSIKPTTTILVITSGWIVALGSQQLLTEIFRGYKDFRSVAIFGSLLNSMISVGGLLIFYLCHIPTTIEKILLLFFSATFFNLLVAWKQHSKRLNSFRKVIHYTSHLYLLQEAWPVLIVNLSMFLVRQLDLWIIGVCCSLYDVAIYGAALRIVIVIGFFLEIVHAVIPPFISSLYSQKKLFELELVIRGITTLASLPALVTFLILAFKGQAILNFVYGQEYQNGVTVLLILGMGKVIHILSGPCGLVLLMTGYQRTLMFINFFCGAIMVTTSLLLVHKWGAVGVAMATTGVLIIQNILTILSVRKKVGFWPNAGLTAFFNFKRFARLLQERA